MKKYTCCTEGQIAAAVIETPGLGGTMYWFPTVQDARNWASNALDMGANSFTVHIKGSEVAHVHRRDGWATKPANAGINYQRPTRLTW
jgi:hypothetical protein